MRQRAERAMGRGMTVAANDGGAGQREALLGTDDVYDALTPVELVVVFDAEFPGVLFHDPHLLDAFRVRIGFGAIGGRDIVIDHSKSLLRCANLASGGAQPLERLRRCHLMDQMAIDIEQAGAVVGFVNQVVVPDLVVQRGRFGHERQALNRD